MYNKTVTRDQSIFKKVINLRKGGKTYTEIQTAVPGIPKSTLSNWCSGILLTKLQQKGITIRAKEKSDRGRQAALNVNRARRQNYLDIIRNENLPLKSLLVNKDIAKTSLAVLYLAEGAKTRRGSLMFGNSDPGIIKLFLRLLNICYVIDKSKFRCTLLCRADQDIAVLEKFWSDLTEISPAQFYAARIDKRTIGKVSRKKEYKGVCRIDYFNAHIYHDLMSLGKVLCE